MKKIFGLVLAIGSVLIMAVLKATTGSTNGGAGLMGNIVLFGCVFFGWSLFKSDKE